MSSTSESLAGRMMIESAIVVQWMACWIGLLGHGVLQNKGPQFDRSLSVKESITWLSEHEMHDSRGPPDQVGELMHFDTV